MSMSVIKTTKIYYLFVPRRQFWQASTIALAHLLTAQEDPEESK